MDMENTHWDQADQEFNLWLDGVYTGSSLLLSDLLKSIYLVFRQKEIERLNPFCKQAFEYYLERESIKRQKVYETEYEYNRIMFRKISLSEAELDAKTQRENQRIIDGILSGDQKVFNSLHESELPKVIRLIERYSGCIDVAQDVFQDAIVILVEKIYAKKLDLICSVKTYLYSICKYLWLDELRQNKKEKQMIEFYDEEFQTDDISVCFYNTPDIYENVNSAIDTLGEPCKQLLECFYYKNMNWDEIASLLGYATSASARNQKYKCLERVRKMVSVEVE